MTANMRTVLKYLADSPDLTGYLYVHRNTRVALLRRGLMVPLGSGLFGLTTLGLRVVTA